MAAGKYAFRRDTMADTLAASCTRAEADRRAESAHPLVSSLDHRALLAKDVGERYSATDDLARELRWTHDHLSEALVDPKPMPERRAACALEADRGVALAAVAGALSVIGLMNHAGNCADAFRAVCVRLVL
jgi:hypothetical protein